LNDCGVARTRLVSAGWDRHSIAGIAHSCGFGSHATFATAFRQEFGMTPSEARHGTRRLSGGEWTGTELPDDLVG
jgi:AraC-like DNA-binding protein